MVSVFEAITENKFLTALFKTKRKQCSGDIKFIFQFDYVVKKIEFLIFNTYTEFKKAGLECKELNIEQKEHIDKIVAFERLLNPET